MCGISTILALWPARSAVQTAELEQSLRIIEHRGPDGRGIWVSKNARVGLGHVRLSFLDLGPGGAQPFKDDEHGIYAVVNGELYEHEKHRQLLADEHCFIGESDCEIVIALYKRYGFSFLSHLRGEFALVVWDANRELLLAATDRYGTKSLYYTVIEDRLLIATEMKCFLELGWEPQWCIKALRTHAWQFGTQTMFKEVYKVI